ncbi:MAG: PQQ-binding-like beta-propeller repeat protein [Chloroflexota bacterium]|nr:MAG: PQQ-binding-like beta-propeller repeat protein [Chloroflexota bacterium]
MPLFKLHRLPLLLLLPLGVLFAVNPLLAQSSDAVYWRYDAPGRLTHIVIEDVDNDGLDEFIVVADGRLIMAVESNGRAAWSVPFEAENDVVHLTTLNSDGLEPTADEIVLATEARLVLLNSEGQVIWRRPLRARPSALLPLSSDDSMSEDILVAHADGSLLRFNGQGFLVWEYDFTDLPAQNATPHLAVADLDRDGLNEIVYSYFADDGFSKLVMMDWQGQRRWERSDSGRVTAMTLADFDPSGEMEIALATTLDRVYLYTAEGDRRWPYRTPNRLVTALTFAVLDEQPALIIGTDAGTAIAYDAEGQRIWSHSFSPNADRPASAISVAPYPRPQESLVDIALLLGQPDAESGQTEIILLDGDGRRLEPSYVARSDTDISRVVDINRDGRNELLLAGFATLELLDPGIGARQYFEAWDYRLGAKPEAILVEDIDDDGQHEILVGNNDGSIHALESDGASAWTATFDGVIAALDHIAGGFNSDGRILVAHNQIVSGEDGLQASLGRISILLPDGTTLVQIPVDSTVSSILVADLNQSDPDEFVVGTTDGHVIAYSLSGEELWRASLNASIDHLTPLESVRGPEIVLATGANTIVRLNNKGNEVSRVASYLEEVADLKLAMEDGAFVPVLLAALDDGTVRSLSAQGNQLWQNRLEGLPVTTYLASNSLFVGTDDAELVRIGLGGDELLRLPVAGRITSVYFGDLDGDVRPDIALGNRDGEVRLLTGDSAEQWAQLDLGSEVFHITALRRSPDLQAELLAVTENGVVQLLRSQANRPPLLIDPVTEVNQNEYSISVSVIDVENDPVGVSLELQDGKSGQWFPVGEKVARSGRDTLFWAINPPDDAAEVNYRFTYDDGTHEGIVQPAAGPPPILPGSTLPGIIVAMIVGLAGAVAAVIYVRQARSPDIVARRFFRRQQVTPEATLKLLEEEYNRTGGSPDFLLSLANRARREGESILASLADGLFLLAARPESGLPVINGALDDADRLEQNWQLLDEWRITYSSGHSLLTAPTLTQLSLMYPVLEHLILVRSQAQLLSGAFEGLLAVLGSIRDSERVDLAEDRVVNLNEALGLLRQLEVQAKDWPIQIENTLVKAIADRWLGLVRSEVEELHGRAQLVVNLLTKNVVPDPRTVVALSIRNVGRAPAEHVEVTLLPDENCSIVTRNQNILYLSPGRSRQLYFAVEPAAVEQFRVEFNIDYEDRHSEDKHVAFADMVQLLPREREYSTVVNPYSPGMPLRSNSAVFFGREQLFGFVKENAAGLSQKNVLILVGQRRTGKTSALLRLDRHLAEDLLPVYIDCQSLGVSPGLPSLFNDLAWLLADALALRGLALDIPEAAYWQQDAGRRFEREFLPQARSLLPPETTIVMVFDEFESFEDLVREEILPPTLFSYLRHLMQHAEGVSFIFAGTHRLEEMGTDYWSVLFNSALYRHVGFLDYDSAVRLIRDPVSPNLVYDDIAVDKILRVTAGHPYFLQLVCYTLVNQANQRQSSYITISDVNAALDEMLRLGEVHFAYIWQRSLYPERALLAASSRLMDFDSPFRPDDLVDELRRYGINLQAAQVTGALNRLVERGIMREIGDEGVPLYEMRIGLVGLWVAQNKSFSRLYASTRQVEASSPA